MKLMAIDQSRRHGMVKATVMTGSDGRRKENDGSEKEKEGKCTLQRLMSQAPTNTVSDGVGVPEWR